MAEETTDSVALQCTEDVCVPLKAGLLRRQDVAVSICGSSVALSEEPRS